MNNKLFLIFLVLVLVIPLVYAGECNKDLSVYLQFKAFQEKDPIKLSAYQAPDYKEDDLLRLWRLIIVNNANCDSATSILKLKIKSPQEDIDHLFCRHSLEIPQLKPNSTYWIIYSGVRLKQIGNAKYRRYEYIDSNNKTLDFCGIRLLYPGFWKVEGQLEEKDSTEFRGGSIGWSIIDDNWNIEHLDFKVRSKSEVLNLEMQKWTITLSLVAIGITVIVGLATILIQIYLTQRQRSITKKSPLKK